MKKVFLPIVILMLFVSSEIKAQDESADEGNKMSFLINVGVVESGYDYDDINFSNGLGMSIGILAERDMCRFFNLGVHLGYTGASEGGVADTWSAEYDYFANIIDFGLQGRIKIANGSIMEESSKFQPSIIFGGGGAFISTSGNANYGKWDDSFFKPKVNGGIGIEYVLNESFSIGLQSEFQYFFTDDIDGHIATISENNKADDIFMATSLTLRFTPGK